MKLWLGKDILFGQPNKDGTEWLPAVVTKMHPKGSDVDRPNVTLADVTWFGIMGDGESGAHYAEVDIALEGVEWKEIEIPADKPRSSPKNLKRRTSQMMWQEAKIPLGGIVLNRGESTFLIGPHSNAFYKMTWTDEAGEDYVCFGEDKEVLQIIAEYMYMGLSFERK